MTFDTQKAVNRLNDAKSAILNHSLSIAQTECRKVLEMLAHENPGVIQYERSTAGYRMRLNHGSYQTWGFAFRWIEDAFEYLQLLQELGYELETEEMSEAFYFDLRAEQQNVEEQAARAAWLEEHMYA